MPQFKDREEYERWKAERTQAGAGQQPGQEQPGEKGPGDAGEPGPPVKPAAAPKQLTPIGELFRAAWEIYKRRIGTLIGLYLFSIFLLLLGSGIFIGSGILLSLAVPDLKTVLIVSGIAIGVTVGLTLMFWAVGAFIFAVTDEGLGFGAALRKGWQKLGAFLWLVSVFGFLIGGGFLLFFVPGIIFLVWFTFGQFILAAEDVRGMNALLKSRAYVKGYWFEVFLRLFLVWIISAFIGMVPFLGVVFSILFFPFMTVFAMLVYKDLREIKGEVEYSPTAGEKFKWIGTACLGYIVFPLLLVACVGVSLTIPFLLLKGMMGGSGKGWIVPPDFIAPPSQQGFLPRPTNIEGVWTGKEANGADGWTFIFFGANVEVTGPDGREVYRGTVTLNEEASPKQLDVKVSESIFSQYLGKTSAGIYRIEGDVLSLCAAEPGAAERPTEFSTAGKARCFTLARQEAADEPLPGMHGSGGLPRPGGPPRGPEEALSSYGISINSLNYKGVVRLNGEDLYDIKGEQGTSYSYTGNMRLRPGRNLIEVEYTALPGGPGAELRIRVFRYDWRASREEVVREWVMNDRGGKQSLEIDALR